MPRVSRMPGDLLGTGMISATLMPYVRHVRLFGQKLCTKAMLTSPISYLRLLAHKAAFANKYREMKRRSAFTLLNHQFVFNEFNHSGSLPTSFSWSHGADKGSYLGSGLLYF